MKKFFLIIGLLGILSVSACGRFSAPSPYPDSGYPHTYPRR